MEKLLNKFSGVKNRRKGRGSNKSVKKSYKWSYLILIPLWTLISYVVAAITIAFIEWILESLSLSPSDWLQPTLYQFATSAIVYALSILIAVGVPHVIKHNETTMQDIGLSRLMSWTDIGLAPVTFLAYLIASSIFFQIVVSVVPGFPADQVQDIGFSLYGSKLQIIFVFLALIVIAPIAEEVLFRGYLYGKLKIYVPAFWAAIMTSIAFAAVHLQWNVAIDVFVLSMFLCGLRSLTGSLWAGILVHMIKNSVAFFILIGSTIGG